MALLGNAALATAAVVELFELWLSFDAVCCLILPTLVTGLLGAVLEFELDVLVVLEFGLLVTIVELESLEKFGSTGVAGTFLDVIA